jgi:hypothetical protein
VAFVLIPPRIGVAAELYPFSPRFPRPDAPGVFLCANSPRPPFARILPRQARAGSCRYSGLQAIRGIGPRRIGASGPEDERSSNGFPDFFHALRQRNGAGPPVFAGMVPGCFGEPAGRDRS